MYDFVNQSTLFCFSQINYRLADSLSRLFWSLFNPIDLDAMHIDPQYQITFGVGYALYAIYMVVVVVVMLNALIAMMSNTYTRVEVSWITCFVKNDILYKY